MELEGQPSTSNQKETKKSRRPRAAPKSGKKRKAPDGEEQAFEAEEEGSLAPELYCLCRQPDDSDRQFIECDSCHQWYHPDCVGIVLEVIRLLLLTCNHQMACNTFFLVDILVSVLLLSASPIWSTEIMLLQLKPAIASIQVACTWSHSQHIAIPLTCCRHIITYFDTTAEVNRLIP